MRSLQSVLVGEHSPIKMSFKQAELGLPFPKCADPSSGSVTDLDSSIKNERGPTYSESGLNPRTMESDAVVGGKQQGC